MYLYQLVNLTLDRLSLFDYGMFKLLIKFYVISKQRL